MKICFYILLSDFIKFINMIYVILQTSKLRLIILTKINYAESTSLISYDINYRLSCIYERIQMHVS